MIVESLVHRQQVGRDRILPGRGGDLSGNRGQMDDCAAAGGASDRRRASTRRWASDLHGCDEGLGLIGRNRAVGRRTGHGVGDEVERQFLAVGSMHRQVRRGLDGLHAAARLLVNK